MTRLLGLLLTSLLVFAGTSGCIQTAGEGEAFDVESNDDVTLEGSEEGARAALEM